MRSPLAGIAAVGRVMDEGARRLVETCWACDGTLQCASRAVTEIGLCQSCTERLREES